MFCFQQIIDPAVVGQYDAVVVHADNAAVEFFQKYGFSDDIVLNSRWRYVMLRQFIPRYNWNIVESGVKHHKPYVQLNVFKTDPKGL